MYFFWWKGTGRIVFETAAGRNWFTSPARKTIQQLLRRRRSLASIRVCLIYISACLLVQIQGVPVHVGRKRGRQRDPGTRRPRVNSFRCSADWISGIPKVSHDDRRPGFPGRGLSTTRARFLAGYTARRRGVVWEMDAASFQRAYDGLPEFHAFFAPSFGRKQWREYSRNCLRTRLVQAQERSNAENLSESVGISARAMRRLLTEARWDDDAFIGRLLGYPVPRLGHPRRCGYWTAAAFPGRGGNRQGWPGSTAVDCAGWPTAKPRCSWPTSAAPWAGRWWTTRYSCPRVGLPTRSAVRWLVGRRSARRTGARRSWPRRCWRQPRRWVFSRLGRARQTTPSVCRLPSVRERRP